MTSYQTSSEQEERKMLNNGYEASENNSEQEDELKQEIQEYKEEKEKVENLGCTIPSIIVFLLLGAIWGSACKYAIGEKIYHDYS